MANKKLPIKQGKELDSNLKIGIKLCNSGDPLNGKAHFEKVLMIDPLNQEALFWKATALSESAFSDDFSEIDTLKEAIEVYNALLDINPNHDRGWNNKGYTLYNLHRYSEALKCYDIAIKIDPNSDAAWNNKGLVLIKLNKLKEALLCFDRSIQLKERQKSKVNLFPWYNKGKVLVELEDCQGAIKCYDEAIRIDRTDYLSWLKKGVVLSMIGSYTEAIKCFDQVIKLYPEYADSWYNKGLALSKLSQIKEAVECFNTSLKLGKLGEDAYSSLMIHYFELNLIEKLHEVYKKALQDTNFCSDINHVQDFCYLYMDIMKLILEKDPSIKEKNIGSLKLIKAQFEEEGHKVILETMDRLFKEHEFKSDERYSRIKEILVNHTKRLSDIKSKVGDNEQKLELIHNEVFQTGEYFKQKDPNLWEKCRKKAEKDLSFLKCH